MNNGLNKLRGPLLTVVVFFLFSQPLFSQIFKGVITDAEGNPVSDCYVLLINEATNEVIAYAVPDIDGTYSIRLDDRNVMNVMIKCQGLSYNSQTKKPDIKHGISLYTINFRLSVKAQKLDDVIIISDRIAVTVKNDTVVYDVSKFKRIEDRKIINVLKNMPGIQVDEITGIIQYKGKPIETLLLDGDDLFGKSYSVGARNISSDMVDKVEAIEDYHDNRLKKGLKKSDKVVLNLKFKRNKFKISGEAGGGIGKNSHLANVNLLNLSNKVKGFGVFTVNNISVDETSYQRDTYNNENREEIENSSIDFFRESSITQPSFSPRSYINNLKFATYNNLFKFSDRISLKNNISFFNDINRNSFESGNEFYINGDAFRTTNKTFNTAKPWYVSTTNEFNFNVSRSSILKYQNRYVYHLNTFIQNNLQNDTVLFESRIDHSKQYFQQSINYTKKISEKGLIEGRLVQSSDIRKQRLQLLNPKNIVADEIIFDQENTGSQRVKFAGEISYFRKVNNWNLEFTAKQTRDNERYNIAVNANLFNYRLQNSTSHLFIETSYEKNKKIKSDIKVGLGYSDRYLQDKSENTTIKKKGVYINSEAKVRLKPGKNSHIVLGLENSNKLNDHYYLFSSPLLMDSRTVTSSKPSLNFQELRKGYLNFYYYDLLKQSGFSFLGSYEEVKNSFLAEQRINENISIVTYFQTPLSRKDINLSASESFYVDVLNNKVSLNANTNFSRYFNLLNNNPVNEVSSSVYNTNLELNSAFEIFFNYKGKFGFTFIENKQKGADSFLNSNINARVEAIFKLAKKTYCKLENELLLPRGGSITKNQFFTDFSFNHTDNKIEYFILARNIFNKGSFTQIHITEFSTSIFSNNLFSRSVVGGLKYSF